MEHDYELRLASGKRVVWSGNDPEDASRRYVDCHRSETVVAWRSYPRYGLFIGMPPGGIVELEVTK